MLPVQFGIDRLLTDAVAWKGKKIALVTNHAATTSRFQPSRVALLEHGFGLVKLFSPEHGLDTTGVDGQLMPDEGDPLTGLPVISLYGEKLRPSGEDLADVDCVLFDIPDTGSRFYTYLWTLTHVMEACAEYDKPLVITDRPNPVSGLLELAEGPMLDERTCSSFIGRWEMPVRHSCSFGELASYFNKVRSIHCRLEVIPCENWRRSSFYPGWRTSFVPTSPAINSFESALLYPALCFLEATNISEGRGTALPFRVAGAPWMEAEKVVALLKPLCYSRPFSFTPVEGKYAGQSCSGIMLHVADPAVFRPVATGLILLKLIRDLHPGHFAWAPYPTHVNGSGSGHLDLLSGIKDAERLFEWPMADFSRKVWSVCSAEPWREKIRPYLLYS